MSGGLVCSTIVDLLRLRAAERPEITAYTFLVDGEVEAGRLTYRQLDDLARGIGAALSSAGASGERVLLLYPPGLEFVGAFLGALYAGALAVPAYPPRSARGLPRLRAIAADSRPRVMLTTAALLDRTRSLLGAAPELEGALWLATDGLEAWAEAWRKPVIDGETVAFLQYTSGSTSTPKGVMISHANLLHNEEMIRRAFDQSQESVILGWLPLYHDMGLIGNVLQPLYVGAPCVLMSPVSFLQNPLRWLAAISRYRATTSGGPNFAYELCARKITDEQKARLDLSSWRVAFNGAEPVRAETLERFATAFASCGFRREAFYPCYGLAEATLFAAGGRPGATPVVRTFAPVGLEEGRAEVAADGCTLVGCGSAWMEQRIAIVDPETARVCPAGRVGEIWIAGPSMARGYWSRPDATERDFLARLAEEPETGPFLRTGDLGFLAADGELFVTGRLKDLIILRGRNHYPQDIERTAEEAHPTLRPGCGAAFSVELGGEERLVVLQELERRAGDAAPEDVAEAIRSAVAQVHEVQVHEVVLLRVGTIAKTSSGKIRRQASRAAYLAGDLAVVARNAVRIGDEVTHAVAEWEGAELTRPALLALEPADRGAVLVSWLRERAARVLRVAPAALDQERPLTALGLDSLAAVELEQELEHGLGAAVPLGRLLEGMTLRGLVEDLLADLALAPQRVMPDGPVAGAAPRGEDVPLSYGQKALWFLQRMAPESAAYHITAAVRVRGALDAAALRRAFQVLAERHPALRTTFHAGSGEPVQRVHAWLEPELREEDASGLTGSELSARLAREVYHRPFDLEAGPLLRATLFRLGPNEHALALVVHHLVADFWSLAVLFDELGQLYICETGGEGELPAAPELTYVDWVQWQNGRLASPEGERFWLYWHEALRGPRPDLDLPTDRPRPAVQTDRGASVALTFGAEVTERVRGLAAASGATLFMTLLAGFQAVLHRWSGQEDLTVGCPVAGRSRPEVAGLVGYFVNPVVVRGDLSGGPTFATLLGRLRRAVLGALENGDYPFALLTERLQPNRDPSRSPLFQTLFVLQKAQRPEQRALAPLALGEAGAEVALGPLSLASLALPERPAQFDLTLSLAESESGLSASLGYNADLFDGSTAARLLGHLRQLLAGATSEMILSDLPLLAPQEQEQILVEWNTTAAEYPAEQTIDQLIAAQAERTPDFTAVVAEDLSLTYAELESRSRQLARYLEKLGVTPEVPVGIFTDRTSDMLVSLLGVLKAGGAYLPLDPAYPEDRISYMLEDSGAPVVLTQDRFLSSLGRWPGRVVRLDTDWPEIARGGDAPLRSRAQPDQLAYLIYTSGSTGLPKGVQIPHRALVNFLTSMARRPGIEPEDTLVSVTTLSFDIAGLEIYLPLLAGARVVLASRESASDGSLLLRLLASSGATMMQATPATWRLLLAAGWDGEPLIRALCGGEALPRDLADRLLERAPAVWNLYGPTETTIWSATGHVGLAVPGGPAVLSIGRPIANTSIYIVDRGHRPVPIGVPGELLIGGHGLARGYRGRPDLTAERFIPDPWSGTSGARLYRTGDLARFRADGEIDFLGRLDLQVKIRGFRIELGEVEAALCNLPEVRQAAVVARPDHSGLQRLVAYAVFVDGRMPDVAALRRALAARLPDPFVPSLFVALDRLPLTPNGKVDRKALPAPEAAPAEAPAAEAMPRSALERAIADIWREVLQVQRIGLHDNFFDLGGHSLLAAQVHARLRETLGVEVSLVDLFRHPTVASLARFLAPEAREDAPAHPRVAARSVPAGRIDIAIVGMAGRFPGAPSIRDFWQRLRDGDECLTVLSDEELAASGVDPALLADPAYVRAAGVLEGADLFDAAFFGFNPREAELMDPQHRVFLECAWQALEDAGYDPTRFDGRIGLYAGVGVNTYLHHAGVERVQALAGRYQAFIANDKDFVPTRASYKLNLRGPSVNVQTACSSSLVAVHLACQALRSGECDMALAGSVAIRSPQKMGYVWEEGGIPSPDGHCRAFDARAQGTVFGNGVGLVVLKPLNRALADGDTIRAVLKGTAINNDGAHKVGYTAPSVEGQAQVIADALDAAGVDAATVTCIEAHGTGTPMGDPIEVAALAEAFKARTDLQGFCALGSVKTNIGHLDTAAGVAGLIKTVLALEHRQIPPSLHFETPNPRIDFASSPFFVNTDLRPWEPPLGVPRRAGISSFGIGGTNVHAVLEEAPAVLPSGTSRPLQLLVLSARTPAALDAVARDLSGALAMQPDLPLADVAHTLRVGRRAFSHRRMLVCESREETAAALNGNAPEKVLGGIAEGAAPEVAFLFSGQGSQHVGMARGLYEQEPVFRHALDECCELLRPHLGMDLRTLLFPPPGGEEEVGRELAGTELGQPALFAVEHSLARLWMAWGIRPAALLGHSVGEYVAACLAGVISLPEALSLVAVRGRLMQSLPPGAMLSVQLPETEVAPLLGADLALAAVNGPEACAVSGPLEAVAALEQRLDERGVRHRRLHTSHAFHSAMMDPILDAFAAEVAKLVLLPPKLPCLSNLSGTWLKAAEATDPTYWARHLRGTVRFADGVRELIAEPGRILLEVGPGNALATLARQSVPAGQGRLVLASLPHPREERPDEAAILQALGRLWLAGLEIDWQGFVASEHRRRVPLPFYPFERQRYWLEPQVRTGAPAAARLVKKADLADWTWAPLWTQTVPPRFPAEEAASWLLLTSSEGAGARLAGRLAAALEAYGRRVTLAQAGSVFSHLGGGGWTVDPARREDLAALVAALREEGGLPDRVVHLLNVTDPVDRTLEAVAADLPGARVRAFDSLLALAQALEAEQAVSGVRLAVVSSHLHRLPGDGPACPEKGLLLGPVAVIPQELEGLACRAIDLALPSEGSANEEDLVEDLLGEIGAWGDPRENVVAWRHGARWVRSFGPARLDHERGLGPRVRDGGVYLITGGLGGLGLTLAAELAGQGRVKLALLGRTPLPPRESWDQAVAAGDERVRRVRELEASGAEVLAVAADVTEEAALAAALADIERQLGPVRGVVHAAGLPGGRLLQLENGETAEAVLAPKVRGTLLLAVLLAGRELDFFVLCSSINAVIGGFGQTGYAAANAFLDAFAAAEHRRHGPLVVSVGWDRWEEVGMAARSASSLALWQREGGAPEHPLLDALVESSAEREVWATELRVERHWVLSEHLILGHPTMPGTTYLEMARAAFSRRAGESPVELREVVFLVPLVVLAGQRREVRTILEGSGLDCAFRIASLGDGPWQEHARGRVAAATAEAPEPLELEALLAACTAGEITELRKTGDFLSTGPRWRSLRRIHLGDGESVAELELNEVFADDLAAFGLHPALLDVAAGAVQVLGDGDYLPLTYDRLTVHAGPAQHSYSHFRLRGEPGEVLTCDITLLDESGRVLAEIAGFSMRRVGREAAEQLRQAAAAPPAAASAGNPAADAGGSRTGDGILPHQGAQVFRRVLRDGALPHLVVSTRDLPEVMEEARSFDRERLAERLEIPAAASTHARPEVATAYAPPTDDLERQVATVWGRVLGIERVGIHDNFFELGGTSLSGIQLVAELKKQLGVDVPTVSIFQAPTVAALVCYLRPAESPASEFERSRSRAEKKKKVFAQARRASVRRRA